MLQIFIDVETRSEADLRKIGQWLYSKHPSTDLWCLAAYIEFEDRSVKKLLLKRNQIKIEKDKKRFLKYITNQNFKIEAHNAGFEYVIWHNILVERYGWPEIPLDQWYCSAAKAAIYGLPRSLEKCAQALNLQDQKDMTGHRLMMKMSSPTLKWKKSQESPKWYTNKKELNTLYRYCLNDVKVEYAISKRLTDLDPNERKVWLIDQKINLRGIPIDRDLVNHCIEIYKLEEEKAIDRTQQITDGEVKSPRQVGALLNWINENTTEFLKPLDDLKAETVRRELKNLDKTTCWDEVKIRKSLLEARQVISKTSIKKFNAMLERVDDTDDLIRNILFYHGAHTGRWSGIGVQFQNLARPKLKPHEIDFAIKHILNSDYDYLDLLDLPIHDILSSLIRSSIRAPSGYKFVCSDFSSIETCIIMWLAEDQKGLHILNKGESLYKHMAARIFNKRYNEIEKDTNEYMLGKISILALVYGMGETKDHPTFSNTCKTWGAKITHKLAQHIVYDIFREEYRSITKFWKYVQNCFVNTIETKRPTILEFQKTQIRFSYPNDFLFITLPSGRRLAYYKPKIKKGNKIVYTGVRSDRSWGEVTTHGGKLTENIDQGIAADLMRIGILNAEEKDYKTILTVHDELLCQVPIEFGSVKELNRLICKKEKWAYNLPLSASGWEGKIYRK